MSHGHGAIEVGRSPTFGKFRFFPQHVPFSQVRNRIGFSKFQCYMDHFSMPLTKMQSKLDFVKFVFLGSFPHHRNRAWKTNAPKYHCGAQLAIHKCSRGSL